MSYINYKIDQESIRFVESTNQTIQFLTRKLEKITLEVKKDLEKEKEKIVRYEWKRSKTMLVTFKRKLGGRYADPNPSVTISCSNGKMYFNASASKFLEGTKTILIQLDTENPDIFFIVPCFETDPNAYRLGLTKEGNRFLHCKAVLKELKITENQRYSVRDLALGIEIRKYHE